MKIFVAGASGQVARSLSECGASSQHEIVCLGRPDLDITNEDSVARAIGDSGFDLVINAAAYTGVDAAETDEDAAMAANADGATYLAEAAERASIPIFHLSTDYVFDGTLNRPYEEEVIVNPLGIYGKSKLAGETGVNSASNQYLILRTAWVYSPFGKNFVKTMLRLAEGRDEVSVVADQIGCPTYALDIAEALLKLADAVESREGRDTPWGIYNLTSPDSGSWADVAEEVFMASSELGGPSASVRRITSAEYPTPVTRPANSRLDANKLQQTFNIRLPNWRQSVKACVKRLID